MLLSVLTAHLNFNHQSLDFNRKRGFRLINWLYKFKYTKRGIDHLMKYIVIISAVVYALRFVGIDLYPILYFDAGLILGGQIWRAVTFIFVTPNTSIIFAVFVFYFYYIIGETLEQQWGSFAFTVYYLLNVAVSVILGLATGGYIVNSYYINLAMFLAYGFSYPNNTVMLFMIIPLKMKYLAWIYVAFEVLWVVTGATLAQKLILLSGIISFIIFFWQDIFVYLRRFLKINKKTPVKPKKNPNLHVIHKCEVCGRTEADDKELQFRFCSRCKGFHEYCMEHLYTHQHYE